MSHVSPPFGISVCGIEELSGHCETGATHVLSILDPDHPVPEAFGQFGEHERVELRFHDIVAPVDGQVLPEREDVQAVLALGRDLAGEAAEGAHLLVHCHMGISRSTAAMVLILAQAMPDIPEAGIVGIVHGLRAKAWPNLRMIEFGDALLGRDGRLIAAVQALHRAQLDRLPHLATVMTESGRGREVEGALALPSAARL